MSGDEMPRWERELRELSGACDEGELKRRVNSVRLLIDAGLLVPVPVPYPYAAAEREAPPDAAEAENLARQGEIARLHRRIDAVVDALGARIDADMGRLQDRLERLCRAGLGEIR